MNLIYVNNPNINNKNVMILCPGSNLTKYQEQICSFIKHNKCITFCVNRSNQFVVPEYHVYTNNSRFSKYGGEVHPSSHLLLGRYIKSNLIQKFCQDRPINSWHIIDYTDRDISEPIGYRYTSEAASTVQIRGYYRCVSCLTIMIATILYAKPIYIAGMDGFTYDANNVHCYKDEPDDIKTKQEWINRYDTVVYQVLKNLKTYGAKFDIITPTIYSKFYMKGAIQI